MNEGTGAQGWNNILWIFAKSISQQFKDYLVSIERQLQLAVRGLKPAINHGS